jgi:hypothetical protein
MSESDRKHRRKNRDEKEEDKVEANAMTRHNLHTFTVLVTRRQGRATFSGADSLAESADKSAHSKPVVAASPPQAPTGHRPNRNPLASLSSACHVQMTTNVNPLFQVQSRWIILILPCTRSR